MNVTLLPDARHGTVRAPASKSQLHRLLPVAGVLGAEAVFRREGRLPERPLAPLDDVLCAHGMRIWTNGVDLYCKGKLLAGDYEIAGDISSQLITGLLYALPLLRGNSTLTVTGKLVSAPYVTMTEGALQQAGIQFTKVGNRYTIPGGQRYTPPQETCAEGDWSGAAAFLCMGALSREGGTADAANDHRIAMAAVAAGACLREVTITGAECVDKSYPGFWEEPIWRSM